MGVKYQVKYLCVSLIFNNFAENLKYLFVMKKSDTEKENERLKKALERKKMENKKLRQQVKYAKDTKNGLKAELKRVKSERDEEVKKTPVLRKSLNELREQRWQSLERKIRERFPDGTARSVLSVLASSFMSGRDAGSGE